VEAEEDSESDGEDDDEDEPPTLRQEERDEPGVDEPSFAVNEEPGDRGEGDSDAGGQQEEQGQDRGLGQGISRLGSAVKGGASALGHAAHEGYQRGKEIGGRGVENHPLVLCAVSLAAGAALGFLLPATPFEDQMMGKMSDRVTGNLMGRSRDLIGQGKQLVTRALDEAVRATAREAEKEGLTPRRLGRKVKRVVANVRESVANTIGAD
jgi:hypothetical protein